jgi:MoxR-like ATPase
LEFVDLGASVRASLALERAVRGWALVHGRGFVVPDDFGELFGPVVAHRLMLSEELVLAEEVSRSTVARQIWEACLERAPRPEPDWDDFGRAVP